MSAWEALWTSLVTGSLDCVRTCGPYIIQTTSFYSASSAAVQKHRLSKLPTLRHTKHLEIDINVLLVSTLERLPNPLALPRCQKKSEMTRLAGQRRFGRRKFAGCMYDQPMVMLINVTPMARFKVSEFHHHFVKNFWTYDQSEPADRVRICCRRELFYLCDHQRSACTWRWKSYRNICQLCLPQSVSAQKIGALSRTMQNYMSSFK